MFVAEQTEPVKRKVALKVIKPGMDTKDVIARFEAERQALAMMDHPNVARVVDAGTTDSGHPYFVMELVRGLSITDFCDNQKLSNGDRLRLFVDVCLAVQHAHQKGIIHRDLKPTNIMVTMHDDKPVAKVIDFGISKALSQKLTEKTIYTAYGQMVGTPLYMSPEQVQLSDLDVDTRSDVYSLGVLLYQLLTGTTTFDRETFKRVGLDELRRIIREDNPPRPSNRVSTLNADALATVCDQRQVDCRELRQSIRGDLDWIAMKALEKDRTRRYESAAALAADVSRYLDDEPVEARPPSSIYVLRKFIRRHKAAIAAMTITVASLLVGLAISVWQWLEAAKARQLAEDNLLVARQAVDDMYTQFGEKWLSSQPGMTSLQREFLAKALSYYEHFTLQDASNPHLRQKAGEAYIRVADILNALERFSESENASRQAIVIFGELVAESPHVPAYRHHLGRSCQSLAYVLGDTGREREAYAAQLRAVAIYEALVDEFPKEPRYLRGLGLTTNSLGHAYIELDRRDEAETTFRQALALHERALSNSPTNVDCLIGLASSLHSLGSLLTHENPDPSEAETMLRRAVTLREQIAEENRAVPSYTHRLAMSYSCLRNLLWQTGRRDEAGELSRKARLIWEKLADDFPEVLDYRASLAREYQSQSRQFADEGQLQKSEQVLRRSLALRQHWVAAAPNRPAAKCELGEVYHALGRLLYMAGRLTEADRVHRQGLALHEKLAADFPASLGCQRALANGRWRVAQFLALCPDAQLRDPHRALELAASAIQHQPKHGGYWTVLGIARYRAADWEGALSALQTSMNLPSSRRGALFRFFLAMTHWQLGDKSKAHSWYDQAVEWMDTLEREHDEHRRVRREAERLMGISAAHSKRERDESDEPALRGKPRTACSQPG